MSKYHLRRSVVLTWCGRETDYCFIVETLEIDDSVLSRDDLCYQCRRSYMAKDTKTDIHIKRDSFSFCGRSLNKRHFVETDEAFKATCKNCKKNHKSVKKKLLNENNSELYL